MAPPRDDGGALYLNTGARQFLKLHFLSTEGARFGQLKNVRLAFNAYVAFIVVGLLGKGLAGGT